MFAARTFDNGDCIGSYHGIAVHVGLYSRRHTRCVFRDSVLNMDVARFSKYARQLRVQSRDSDRIMERLGNAKTVCNVPARFSVCA